MKSMSARPPEGHARSSHGEDDAQRQEGRQPAMSARPSEGHARSSHGNEAAQPQPSSPAHASDEEFPQIRVMQKLGRTYRAMLAAFDTRIGQPMPRWRVLLMLYQRGITSQKKLADVLRMDPAALTRQLKTIEQLGWVQRRNDPDDNRLTNVWLTTAGLELVEQTMPRRTVFIQRMLADLTAEELELLGGMLDRIETRMRHEAPRANPD